MLPNEENSHAQMIHSIGWNAHHPLSYLSMLWTTRSSRAWGPGSAQSLRILVQVQAPQTLEVLAWLSQFTKNALRSWVCPPEREMEKCWNIGGDHFSEWSNTAWGRVILGMDKGLGEIMSVWSMILVCLLIALWQHAEWGCSIKATAWQLAPKMRFIL